MSVLGRIICVGPSELTLDEEFVDVTASISGELTDVDVVLGTEVAVVGAGNVFNWEKLWPGKRKMENAF